MLRKAFLLLLFLSSLAACSRAPRDYLLVIDTSGSMTASGLIGEVKQGMSEFLTTVEPGDTVTLVRFDQRAAIGETIDIRSREDRNRVQTAVDAMEARGAYTDMGVMLRAISDRASSTAGRERFVVVMSDGKDDPPPGVRRSEIDLGSMRDPEVDEDVNAAYIYYISLGRLKDPDLERELERISPRTTTVQAGPGVESSEGATAGERTGLAQVAGDIERTTWLRWIQANWSWLRWLLLALILLLLLIYVIYRIVTGGRVRGTLSYYEVDVGPSLKSAYTLDKLDRNRVSIGSKLGADLRIRNSGIVRNVALKATTKRGQNLLRPAATDVSLFQFLSQKQEGLISPGDRFRLGNFIFEYNDGGSGE